MHIFRKLEKYGSVFYGLMYKHGHDHYFKRMDHGVHAKIMAMLGFIHRPYKAGAI